MAIRYYDEALLKKLKNWIKDPNMTITGPNETHRLFSYLGDISNDQPIKLPIIALRRVSPVRLLSTNKKPLTFNGWNKNADFENRENKTGKKKIDQLNGVPIEINYQLDIYTRYFAEGDEYLRNFVFQIINHPKLSIEIPYNESKIIHESNIRINQDLEDNSDIPERLIEGQFTRMTLSIYIDDAYLFDYKIKDNIEIESVDLESKLETDTDFIVETIDYKEEN